MAVSDRVADAGSTLPETEVSPIRSELTDGEWTFRDARHRGFVLQAGRGRAKVADGEIPFVAPCLIWLPAGEGTRLRVDAGSRGMALAVTEVGLARAIPVGPNAGQIRAALMRPIIQARLDMRNARRLADTLESITEEGSSNWPGAQECVRHHLALFVIAAWRLSGPVLRETQPLPRTIVYRFLHAIELHLRDHWTIERYATEVGVTSDRLNATVRRITGRSPLALIHARLILEADALLDDSRLQISEIAQELGFHDPAYFSRFYKRHTGQPPNRQRREILRRNGRPIGSFAAWP